MCATCYFCCSYVMQIVVSPVSSCNSTESNEDVENSLHSVCHACAFLATRGRYLCKKRTNKNNKWSWGYLRSPPLPLSVGPHMEKQASGPLGTDVCSPIDSSPVSHGGRAGTWPPAHDHLQPQVIHTWNRRGENFAQNANKHTARKSTPAARVDKTGVQ